MRMHRKQQATTGFLVLAVLLGWLWTGGLATSAEGTNPAGRLTASQTLPGIGPAALPDGAPALRPPVERSGQSGRLVPLLLGMPVAALVAACMARARRSRSGAARARSLLRFTPLDARAPPTLQPA